MLVNQIFIKPLLILKIRGEGDGAEGAQPTRPSDDLQLCNITSILQHLYTSLVSYVVPQWCTASEEKSWIRPRKRTETPHAATPTDTELSPTISFHFSESLPVDAVQWLMIVESKQMKMTSGRCFNSKWEQRFNWLRYPPSVDGCFCTCYLK